MNIRKTVLFFVITLMFIAAPPSLYCASLPNINVYFLSQINTIEAHQHFKLAVKFDIPAPWYIYAHDSGDVGVATHVSISLPVGFTQEEIHWSPYQKINKAGNLSAQVYQHDAVIIFTLVAPISLSSHPLEFKAQLHWLACTENQCIPMKKQLSLHFPRQHVLRTQEHALFKKWGKIMLQQH